MHDIIAHKGQPIPPDVAEAAHLVCSGTVDGRAFVVGFPDVRTARISLNRHPVRTP
jgi:hypothetical protein